MKCLELRILYSSYGAISISSLASIEDSDLSRCVYDFSRVLLSFVENLVAESILDRWVVAFHEMAFAVLYSQRRFAFMAVSKDMI